MSSGNQIVETNVGGQSQPPPLTLPQSVPSFLSPLEFELVCKKAEDGVSSRILFL
jgi:hypothetical protein